MVDLPKEFKNLCTPASIYFFISIFGLFLIFIQNFRNTHSYHVGNFSCRVPNTTAVFVAKLIYVLFWTYVINLICKDGHGGLAWLLVLFPFLLLWLGLSWC
jgi:hypothetical protein